VDELMGIKRMMISRPTPRHQGAQRIKLLLSSCFSVFVLISNATAAELPNPIDASLLQQPRAQNPGVRYRVRYSPRTGIFLLTPASGAPPVGPAGIDQVLTKAWQTAHNAGFNALAVVGASGTATATSPVGADEVANAVWNSANNALAVYCILGCGAAVSGPAANGVLFTNPTGALFSTATGGAGTLCLVETNGGTPTFGSCGSPATTWSSLVNPNSNLALTLGNNTTTLTVGTATTNPWILQDTTGNTGTNPLFQVNTVGTSTAAVAAFYAKGTSNGVSISNAGVLAPAGTGVINANQVNGATLPASAALVTTNSSSQLTALSTSGNTGNMLTNNGTSAAWTGPALLVDQFAGADLAAKVNACFAVLPTTGGVCDARALTGSQTASTTIVPPTGTSYVTLLLGAATITSSANPAIQLVPTNCSTSCGGSQVIGLGPGTTYLKTSVAGATAVRAGNFTANGATCGQWNIVKGLTIQTTVSSGTNTGIGVDWTGACSSTLEDLDIIDYQIDVLAQANTVLSPSVACLYDNYYHVSVRSSVANEGYTGMWLRNNANAQRMVGIRFNRGLDQLVLGQVSDSVWQSQATCVDCTFEAADIISAPSAPTTGSVSGGSLGASSYYAKATYVSIGGETTLSAESTQANVSANNLLTVTSPAAAAGAAGWRPYVTLAGGASGTETLQVVNSTQCTLSATISTACAIGATWTQVATGNTAGNPAPTANGTGENIVCVRCVNANFVSGDFENQTSGAAYLKAGDPQDPVSSNGIYGVKLDNASFGLVSTTPYGTGIGDFTGGGVELRGYGPPAYFAGLSTSSGPNLVPNGMMEGWVGTTTLPGWSGVSGTNWSASSLITQIAETTSNFTTLPPDLGSYSAQFGPTVAGTFVGGGVTSPIYVDSTKPYTLTFEWAVSNTSLTFLPVFQLYNCTRSAVPPSCSVVTTAPAGTLVASSITSTGYAAFPLTYTSACQCFRNATSLTTSTANAFQRATLILNFNGAFNAFNAVRFAFVGYNASATGNIFVDDVYFGQGSALTNPSAGLLADSANGGTSNVNGGLSIAQHLNQPGANADLAHKFTLASGTASYTFSTAFGSTPVCLVSDETTAGGARLSALSTTAYTITGGTTDVVDVVCVGNPN
jgi:hypothetical protein